MTRSRFVFDKDRLARVVAGWGFACAGGASLSFLMEPVAHFGRICGHGLGELHCPGCYAAASVILIGLAEAALAAFGGSYAFRTVPAMAPRRAYRIKR